MNKAALLCVTALLFVLISPFSPPASAKAPSVATHAQGAALIDVKSGRILYSKNGDTPLKIASLTKIMTAIVAIENGNITDTVTVGKNAFAKEGSSLYLKLGEQMSLRNMLYGLMLRSGNDAAVAIAEHVGGSVEGFAYLMNEKARMIGMDHSHFANPHGLDDSKEHLASANDMAKLAAYALQNPVFQDTVKTKLKKVPNPNESWDYTWLNKNKMLSFYEGADGIKTGYTKLAKRCLVSSATRNGQQLAVVTLNDGDDWEDHKRLLDFGFDNYPLFQVAEKGKGVEGTGLVAGSSFYYPVTEEEKPRLSTGIALSQPGSSEFRLGEQGRLTVMLEGTKVGSVPLYPPSSPLLKVPEKLTFQFMETTEKASGVSRWAQAWKSVWRALFVLH